jgi:hypothetical protein
VNDGLAINTANGSAATASWARQVSNWQAYNQAQDQLGLSEVLMKDQVSTGACVFSNNPTGSQHPFSDGIWIKFYNTGPNNKYPFLVFVNGGWTVQDRAKYVNVVCNTNP